MSSTIINNLPGIEHYSYLELGIGNGQNFSGIKCQNKFCVDINGTASYTGTTDNFFSGLTSPVKWDIIFIDANHDYEYVVRDWNNSVDRCNKWLLLHDMVPPTPGHTHRDLCSDSYKVLYHILKYEKFKVYTMDVNYGFTLVYMPAGRINPPDYVRNLPYSQFMEFMAGQKLWNTGEIVDLLQNT